jgi:hypothetical protein
MPFTRVLQNRLLKAAYLQKKCLSTKSFSPLTLSRPIPAHSGPFRPDCVRDSASGSVPNAGPDCVRDSARLRPVRVQGPPASPSAPAPPEVMSVHLYRKYKCLRRQSCTNSTPPPFPPSRGEPPIRVPRGNTALRAAIPRSSGMRPLTVFSKMILEDQSTMYMTPCELTMSLCRPKELHR